MNNKPGSNLSFMKNGNSCTSLKYKIKYQTFKALKF